MLTRKLSNHFFILVWCSIFLALMMQISLMSEIMSFFWPEWTLLLITYWVVFFPEQFSLKFSATIGFLMDGVFNNYIGINMVSFTITAFIIMFFRRRIVSLTLWRQALYISIFIFLYKIFNMWLIAILYGRVISKYELISSITSAICWPYIVRLLTYIQQRLGIY